MDRAQAQEDRAALAVLADRDRIARDLHDVVIQRLFATGLMLQSAVRRAANPDIEERLLGAIADLDTTIRDIRGAIFELSRDGPDTGLRAQIHDIASIAARPLGLRPELVLEGPLDSAVPTSLRPDLAAVLMESLSNAARHADAGHVHVRVATEGSGDGSFVVIEVSDDGRGFATPERESGLRNMRKRAESKGGSFRVESAPGKGTRVCWRAPLRQPDDGAGSG